MVSPTITNSVTLSLKKVPIYLPMIDVMAIESTKTKRHFSPLGRIREQNASLQLVTGNFIFDSTSAESSAPLRNRFQAAPLPQFIITTQKTFVVVGITVLIEIGKSSNKLALAYLPICVPERSAGRRAGSLNSYWYLLTMIITFLTQMTFYFALKTTICMEVNKPVPRFIRLPLSMQKQLNEIL
uniref:Uncharacterized protein n=1 Tax=Glossina pallidipes TaxID=7398 RepID=A0A1A9ZJ72_GLOPL